MVQDFFHQQFFLYMSDNKESPITIFFSTWANNYSEAVDILSVLTMAGVMEEMEKIQPLKMMRWVFPKIEVPQNGWFIMENPIKMDDLGVPLFSETPRSRKNCSDLFTAGGSP